MRLVTTLPMRDWRVVGPAAQRAEAAGYDGVVTNELAYDPFLPLPIAALATERVELAAGTDIGVQRELVRALKPISTPFRAHAA